MLVKFVKPYMPYAKGDVAKLEDAEATKLLKAGICEKADKEKVKK